MMANNAAPTTITLAVEGMSCGNCVRHIGEALTKRFCELPHSIDLQAKTMTVTYDPSRVNLDAVAKVMDEEGYPVRAL